MNLRRTFAVSIGTVAALLLATAAWFAHVAAMASLLDSGAATVRAVAESPDAAHPERFLRDIMLPGIHVRYVDTDDATIYDAQNGTIERHPLPPPDDNGPPPQGDNGPPPPRGNAFARLAVTLAQIPPRHIPVPTGNVTLLMAVDDIADWLAIELVLTLGALTAIGVIAAVSRRSELRAALVLAEQRSTREAEYRRFLADAGHELKTPLTIVTGYIDVLDEQLRGADATQRKIVDGMRSETKRMRDLVEKTLLLARLESRASVPQFVDASAIAKAIAAEIRVRYPERSIDTSSDRGANIIADQADIEAAVRNLIENAARYAPDSPILVETKCNARRVTICVVNQGPGIAAEERPYIFDRFYRGRERTDGEGSGLGLSIVRGVAERWAGTASVDCGNGETRFTLEFPLAEEIEA